MVELTQSVAEVKDARILAVEQDDTAGVIKVEGMGGKAMRDRSGKEHDKKTKEDNNHASGTQADDLHYDSSASHNVVQMSKWRKR